TWLNFSPDHLNLHRSLGSYEQAKAKLWRDQTADDIAIGSVDDDVVLRHLRSARARQVTFGLGADADYRVDGTRLVTDAGALIAGGQNKGLDLDVLARDASRVRAVVAIGDAAGEVEAAFAGVRPVVVAHSMTDAVAAARDLAQPGDAVLLSPACASFDWYGSY